MKPSSFHTLLGIYKRIVSENPAAYFELARTRYTGWAAWLCTDKKEINPAREIYAMGQSEEDYETACALLITSLPKTLPLVALDGIQPDFDVESFDNLLGLYRKALERSPYAYFKLSAHRGCWTAKIGRKSTPESEQSSLGFGEGFTLHMACINCVIDAMAKKFTNF